MYFDMLKLLYWHENVNPTLFSRVRACQRNYTACVSVQAFMYVCVRVCVRVCVCACRPFLHSCPHTTLRIIYVCVGVYVRVFVRACLCMAMCRHVCVSWNATCSERFFYNGFLLTECVYGEYGKWSRCSASCGAGVTARWRAVLVKPDWPPNACRDREQKKQCHEAPCVGGECVIRIFDWEAQ